MVLRLIDQVVHHVLAVAPVEVGVHQFGLILIDLGFGSISFDLSHVYELIIAIEEPTITAQTFIDLPHKICLLFVEKCLNDVDGRLLLVVP